MTNTTSEGLELEVRMRTTGKHNSRLLRRSKMVPAVVYGKKVKPLAIEADERMVERCYKLSLHENPIFKLKSSASDLNSLNVMVRSIDIHPVSRKFIHVDFYALDMNTTIRVDVELHFEGKPKGLADGGVLQAVVREITVECLPNQIPTAIVADVSELGLNQSLHVRDLVMPEGVKAISSGDLTVATVGIPEQEEVVVEATPGAVAADAAAAAGGTAAAPAAAGGAPGAAAGATAGGKAPAGAASPAKGGKK